MIVHGAYAALDAYQEVVAAGKSKGKKQESKESGKEADGGDEEEDGGVPHEARVVVIVLRCAVGRDRQCGA